MFYLSIVRVLLLWPQIPTYFCQLCEKSSRLAGDRPLIYEKTSPSPMKELSSVMSLSMRNRFPFLFLRLSQASVRQFLFQRTQIAVLLA
jgi:hypothetical protein